MNEALRHKLKLAALVTLLAVAPWAWVLESYQQAFQLWKTGSTKQFLLYNFTVVACLAGLLVVPFLRNWVTRLALVAVFTFGFGLDQIYRKIYNQPVSLDDLQLLWRERAGADDAIDLYLTPGLLFGGLALVLGIVFALQPAARRSLRLYWALLPIAAFALVSTVVVSSRGSVQRLPSPYFVTAGFLSTGSSRVLYAGPREQVNYTGELKKAFKHIVLVVDESVRGDYLGLNNEAFDNTPFLNSAAERLANYGVAVSSVNCSVGSRLLLRTGLRENELPDVSQRSLKMPAIWGYARKAGFKTVHIDAFSKTVTGGHSYSNIEERKTIDKQIAIPPDLRPNADDKVADELVALLETDKPMFVLVEKLGTHAPYRFYSPKDLTYQPRGVDALAAASDATQKAQIESYLKATRWVVDRFFEKVLPAADKSNTLLIYTSDHGQSMYEGGYPATHCTNKNAVRGEGLVPLFVVTGDASEQAKFMAEANRAHDRASHYEIFPTLLRAMGYEPEWVTRLFGPSLYDVPISRKRRFLSTAVFNRNAEWTLVD